MGVGGLELLRGGKEGGGSEAWERRWHGGEDGPHMVLDVGGMIALASVSYWAWWQGFIRGVEEGIGCTWKECGGWWYGDAAGAAWWLRGQRRGRPVEGQGLRGGVADMAVPSRLPRGELQVPYRCARGGDTRLRSHTSWVQEAQHVTKRYSRRGYSPGGTTSAPRGRGK